MPTFVGPYRNFDSTGREDTNNINEDVNKDFVLLANLCDVIMLY
jgi:hypothetical protein